MTEVTTTEETEEVKNVISKPKIFRGYGLSFNY